MPQFLAFDLETGGLDPKSHQITEIGGHFGLARTSEFHGAVEDAELCGRVYHRLTTDAQVTA